MSNIQEILFVLVQGFSGAVAGYITNKYAVNMIFKEYTPLKIGGAVKKNKVKFIEEVSELVEKDIINSQTLMGSLKSEDFSNVVNSACKDFIVNSLDGVFKDDKVRDIPKIKESYEKFIVFIEQNLQEELPALVDNFADKIELNNLIQDKQLENISDKIVDIVAEALNSEQKLEEFLECIYDENKTVTLREILGENASDKLTSNISSLLNTYIAQIIYDENKCIQLLEDLYNVIGLKPVLDDLQKKFTQKTIVEIVGPEGIDEIGNLVFENIKKSINDDDSAQKLRNTISELIGIAKGLDVTLFEILPKDIASSLVMYIKENIPNLAPHISNWLYENKEKIDFIINTAVSETVDNLDDDSVKGIIEKFGGMLSSISETLNIVDRASNMVMEFELNEEASNKIYTIIIDFIQKTSVGDIVKLLEEKFDLNEYKLCEILMNLLEEKGNIFVDKFIFKIKNKKISDLVKFDLDSLARTKLIPILYKLILSKKQQIDLYIGNTIESKCNSILSYELGDIVSKQKASSMSKLLPKAVSKYLINNKNACKLYLGDFIKSSIGSVNIEDLIIKNKESIIIAICKKFNDIKVVLSDSVKEKYIKDVFNLFKDKEGLSLSIGEKLHAGIVNNAETIFKGNVKNVIYNNLIKLDEDEICNIAQSFMGKQLKPLSYFGAFLGAIAGLIFAFAIRGTINSLGFYNGYQTTAFACVLMALVGILTNVIALWMIFHPYKKNKVVAKLPLFKVFAHGYIPAHKDGFANGMAYFIDNELLKGKRVESLFINKKDAIETTLVNFISKNNFKVILDLLSEKKDRLSVLLYDFVIDKCTENKAKISRFLRNNIDDVDVNTFIKKDKVLDISNNFLLTISRFDERIIDFAKGRLDKNKTLGELLPADVFDSINSSIEKSLNEGTNALVSKFLKEEVVKSLILNNSDLYEGLKNKTLEEIIGEERTAKLKLAVQNGANVYLSTKLPIVANKYLNTVLQRELAEGKCIGNIFDSKLKVVIDKNLYSITSVAMFKLCDYIQKNEEDMTVLVANAVKGQLNFFIRMAYDFMNGDRLVGLVVSNIIQTKLKGFVNETMYSSIKAVSACANSVIYPTTMNDLKLYYSDVRTISLVLKFFGGVSKNQNIPSNVNGIVSNCLDDLKQIKLQAIIDKTSFNNLDSIYKLFEGDIAKTIEAINNNYNTNIENINKFVNDYIKANITSKVIDNKLDSLIDVDECTPVVVGYALNKFENSEQSIKILIDAVESIYDTNIAKMKFGELLDNEALEADLQQNIDKLFKNIDFNENNKYIVDKVIGNLAESKFEFIEPDTKEYLLKNIISALLNTAVGFTVDSMKALKLKEITTEQVQIMDPEEIHMLFKAFAGDFFIKLYLYGSMGFVFGINLYLSILLGMADLIYNKKIEKIDINTDNIFKE